MVFDQIPNNYSLLVELLYIMHTGNRLNMCKKPPYKYPTTWSHFNLFSSLRLLVVVFLAVPLVMQSLTTTSEILAQLKDLADGMASMHQDVDTLKQASSVQGGNSTTPGPRSAETKRAWPALPVY